MPSWIGCALAPASSASMLLAVRAISPSGFASVRPTVHGARASVHGAWASVYGAAHSDHGLDGASRHGRAAAAGSIQHVWDGGSFATTAVHDVAPTTAASTAHDVTTAAYDVSAAAASHVRGPWDDASSAPDDGTASDATASSVPTTAATTAWTTTADSSARSAVSQSYRVLSK